MEPKFKQYEIVRIVGEVSRIAVDLSNKEGFVVGMSEPCEDGRRDFGVHVNEFGETFAIPERALESTGRMGSAADIVSRSRAGQRAIK
jgi:hypothetical protein